MLRLLVLSYCCLVTLVSSNTAARVVSVSMNKAWPFANPSETYRYYDFPFCAPDEIMPQFMTFGQIMRGDRLVNSLYKINFRENVPSTVICDKLLNPDDIKLLKAAIDLGYMFEMFIAGLPVVSPFGVKSVESVGDDTIRERYFIASNLDFTIGYNEEEVVVVNVTSELDLGSIFEISGADAGESIRIPFSYSVNWVQSDVEPSKALENQLKNHGSLSAYVGAQSMDIHWLAIINSFVLMLLIFSLLLLVIVRVVRTDLSKYLQIDEELQTSEEETGWKLLHADVFRPPVHRLFFCAMVGCGTQLFSMIVMVVLVGCVGIYYQRGGVISSAVIFYMVTAAVGGYYSAKLYQNLGGEKWAWNIFITAMMFSGPLFLVWSFLNTVAIVYRSTAAFPFPTIVLIFAMWACVTFPLTVLGGIVGRHRAVKACGESGRGYSFPCKTNKLAREVPACKWYQAPSTQFFAAGFLPFSAIYIELHYIFHSIWGPKLYTLYGILFLAVVMLLLVAAAVTVLFTYFHLNAEDHRWWWRSYLSGSSVGVFFYVYCFYYYYYQSSMSGFLQSSFFFLYSLLVAYGVMLMLGTVSFTSTYVFMWYIYSKIKAE